MFINGEWHDPAGRTTAVSYAPATGVYVRCVASVVSVVRRYLPAASAGAKLAESVQATNEDVDKAAAAASAAFPAWSGLCRPSTSAASVL